ncbi:MAG: hypothetical protein WCM76_13275, partial [Bacteroidota bacterium]
MITKRLTELLRERICKPAFRIFLISAFIFAITTLRAFATDYYWVASGGSSSGNWSDAVHWSTTSGGTGGSSIPGSADNVFFDANSFISAGRVVTINVATASCKSMDWTGATGTPTLATSATTNTLKIYGSLKLISGMTYSFTGPVYFEATTTGNNITTGGKIFQNNVYLNGIGGEWTLQDNFNIQQTFSYYLYQNNGTFRTNNKNLLIPGYSSNVSSARALYLGSSIFEINNNTSSCNTFDISLTNMTLDAGTSTIRFSYSYYPYFNINAANGPFSFYNVEFTSYNSSYTSYLYNYSNYKGTFRSLKFLGNGYVSGINEFQTAFTASYNMTITGTNTTHYKTTIGGTSTISGTNAIDSLICTGTATISGNNTFNYIIFKAFATINGSNTYGTLGLSKGATYTLQAGYIQTINTALSASGSCGGEFTLKSNSTGAPATISKASGSAIIDYAYLQDITATGGATFTANNTYNLGGNTGWTINAPTPVTNDYYWVAYGGSSSGSWSDGNHWSLTSGGPSAGGCIPGPLSNVFFDANSFTTAGRIVTIDVAAATCKSMDWTGATGTPTFNTTATTNALKIYGSLKLISGMTYSFTGPVYFEATTTGNNITTGGKIFQNNVYLNGIGGEWTLQDNFNIQQTFSYYLYQNNGTFRTNNKNLLIPGYSSNVSSARALYLGSSIFEINNNTSSCNTFDISLTNMTLDAGTSTIRFSYSYYPYFNINAANGPFSFYNVEFTSYNSSYTSYLYNYSNYKGTFRSLKFLGNGYVSGINEFQTAFTASYNMTITGTNTTHYKTTIGGTSTISGTNAIDSLICTGTATISGNNTFNYIKLNANSTINGSNTYGALELMKGGIYTFQAGYFQTITNKFIAQGASGLTVDIQSSSAGSPAYFQKTAGTVACDYIRIKDNWASGGAHFFAGSHSTDQGGNKGWFFVDSTMSAISISVSPSSTIVSGTTAIFQADVVNEGATPSYQWKVNGVDAGTNAPTFSTSTLTNGNTVTCVLTSSIGGIGNNPATSNTITMTVNPVNTFYWIGRTGNWGEGTKWSFSSGGSACNQVPGQNDDVVFDANSFNLAGQTVTINVATASC